MKNKKIRLKLSNIWTRFDGREFVDVKNQRNFQIGDILKKENQYFLTTNKGLKEISERNAHTKIIKKVQHMNPDNLIEIYPFNRVHGRIHRSKTKIIIAHNETPSIYCYNNYNNLSIKARIAATFNLSDEKIKYLISIINNRKINPYNPQIFSKSAIYLAKKELENLIKSDLHFEVNGDYLIVKSGNGKTYYIDLNTGRVSSEKKFICVANPQKLPPPDDILAKAITIAYKPRQIKTL